MQSMGKHTFSYMLFPRVLSRPGSALHPRERCGSGGLGSQRASGQPEGISRLGRVGSG